MNASATQETSIFNLQLLWNLKDYSESPIEETEESLSINIGDLMDSFSKKLADSVLKEIEQFKQDAIELLTTGRNPERSSIQSISYRESELNLEIQANVTDASGQEQTIDINVNLKMSFLQQSGFSRINMSEIENRYAPQMIDPLVIQFGEGELDLSDESFAFDLDADGNKDQIALLKEGYGFLALDRNGNGAVDDGSELFGPKTGDGFMELERFDSNQNGVIEKDDSIYDKLRIWKKNDQGKDELIGLGQAGVGAIYLDTLEAQQILKNSSGQTTGLVTESAAVTSQNGPASIHHIDFAKLGAPDFHDAEPDQIRDYLKNTGTPLDFIHGNHPSTSHYSFSG